MRGPETQVDTVIGYSQTGGNAYTRRSPVVHASVSACALPAQDSGPGLFSFLGARRRRAPGASRGAKGAAAAFGGRPGEGRRGHRNRDVGLPGPSSAPARPSLAAAVPGPRDPTPGQSGGRRRQRRRAGPGAAAPSRPGAATHARPCPCPPAAPGADPELLRPACLRRGGDPARPRHGSAPRVHPGRGRQPLAVPPRVSSPPEGRPEGTGAGWGAAAPCGQNSAGPARGSLEVTGPPPHPRPALAPGPVPPRAPSRPSGPARRRDSAKAETPPKTYCVKTGLR